MTRTPARRIRPADQGTEYAAALLGADKAGAARATPAQALAGYCEDILPLAAPHAGPRLVWQGAMARGMTVLELNAVVARKDWAALDELMFDDPPGPGRGQGRKRREAQ